jgi:hypothetical protein
MKTFNILVFLLISFNLQSQTAKLEDEKSPCVQGFVTQNRSLKVRVVDNSKRYFSLFDNYVEGLNGIAVLIDSDQRKNIFATTGMNLEWVHTDPPYGKLKDLWNAPRMAPMQIEQLDSETVKLTQKAAEASGLNVEIVFSLRENYIDQSITFWPDKDIESSSAFFASYMNLVQNTSLYLRQPPNSEKPGEWLELASAGHGGGGEVYSRPIDPMGLKWNEFHIDNPLLRQAIMQTPESKAATLKAGFTEYHGVPDHFWFGFVDEYILLMIFKEPVFNMWMSASGSMAVRCPAWDYSFNSGPQKAFEKRTYHVRAVYKKFDGINDILKEVENYLKAN